MALNEQAYWLALSLTPYIGSATLMELVRRFGSAQAAWEAREHELHQLGLNKNAVSALLHTRQTLNFDHELRKLDAAGAHLITWVDDTYPPNLRTIADPPPVLYVKGQLAPGDQQALAIVGTRKATRYGRDATQLVAKWLAAHNVTIVSGLAHGIDAAAHRGALEAGGRTLAVLGCGIDLVYPRDHEELAAAVIANGAILSELPLSTPPSGGNFPRRNRIISGLALGVMIGEAPEKSGALITAESALDQGREVFAIPANIFNPIGAGANRLIQEGAKLVMHPRDILAEFAIVVSQQEIQERTAQVAPETDMEALILSHLEADPIHIDDLIRITGRSTAEVTAALTILELKGLAQRVGPMQYCLAR